MFQCRSSEGRSVLTWEEFSGCFGDVIIWPLSETRFICELNRVEGATPSLCNKHAEPESNNELCSYIKFNHNDHKHTERRLVCSSAVTPTPAASWQPLTEKNTADLKKLQRSSKRNLLALILVQTNTGPLSFFKNHEVMMTFLLLSVMMIFQPQTLWSRVNVDKSHEARIRNKLKHQLSGCDLTVRRERERSKHFVIFMIFYFGPVCVGSHGYKRREQIKHYR